MSYELIIQLAEDTGSIVEVNTWPVWGVQKPLDKREAFDVFAVMSSAAAHWFSQRELRLKKYGGAG